MGIRNKLPGKTNTTTHAQTINRRRFLGAAGVALFVPLAGCSGSEADYADGGQAEAREEENDEPEYTNGNADESEADADADESEGEDEGEADVQDADEVFDAQETGEDIEEFNGLKILEHELVHDGNPFDWPKLQGIVQNNSGERKRYVQVSARFYDHDGHQVDSSYTNTRDLDAGATWKFEITASRIDYDEVGEYDVAVMDSARA